VTHEGRFFKFSDATMAPKPVQPGGPPIVVAGRSEAAMKRAARLGDGWQPFKLPPQELETGLATLHDQAAKAGRDLAGFVISLRLGLRLRARPGQRVRAYWSEESNHIVRDEAGTAFDHAAE